MKIHQPGLVLLTLPLIAGLLNGQIAEDPGSYQESIVVRLVEIDVVVTDRSGKRVHGLTPADFELFEGRKRQRITNFTEYGNERKAGGLETPTPTSNPQSVAARREAHSLIILMDSLPRQGFVRSRAIASLKSMLPSLIAGEDDRVSVVLWDGRYQRPRTLLEPSADRNQVMAVLDRLEGANVATAGDPGIKLENQLVDEGARAAASSGRGSLTDVPGQKETNEYVAGELELMFFRRKIAGMTRLVHALGGQQGKKTVLYVENRFTFPSGPGARLAAVGILANLVREANAAGVTFYSVGPDNDEDTDELITRRSPGEGSSWVSLRSRQSDALRYLTLPTGGLYGFGPVETIGSPMAEDLSSYYSIAYQARSDGRDRERKIVVRARNAEYHVRSRTAIVEKSKESMARDTVVETLFSRAGRQEIPFNVEKGAPKKAGRERWLVPIVVRIPSSGLQFATEGREKVARIRIMIAASNGLAEVTPLAESDLRVVAGKDDADGFVKYSVEILRDIRGSELAVGVYDTRSGLQGVTTIDNRGPVE
ncbi:MAG: VWA domain-containing protein [Acidobacteriota bacterium]